MMRDGETARANAQVSDAVREIANVYAAEEKFVDALREFKRLVELVKDSKVVADVGYSLAGVASMLIRLGDFDRAKAMLDETEKRAGNNEGVARLVNSLRRELLYRGGQWSACVAAYSQALREKQTSTEAEVVNRSRQVQCLAFAGKLVEARRLASAVEEPTEDVKTSAAAWLRVSLAMLHADARQLGLLTEPLNYFRKLDQLESLWMAEAVTASAHRRSGDATGASAHAQAGADAWKRMQVRLGDYLQAYVSTGLVKQYLRMDLTK
jgi:tetratricopeptide (TPR) repeat protein